MKAQTTNPKKLLPWLWLCFWSAMVMALAFVGVMAVFGLFFGLEY